MRPLVFFFFIIVFLGSLQIRAQQVGEVPALFLPYGVSIDKATAHQLATAVSAAARAHPTQTSAIVTSVMSSLRSPFLGVLSHHEDKAVAIITSVAKIVPNVQMPRIIYAASKVNPALAPTIAHAATSAVPNLVLTIARSAAAGAPNRASTISHAIISKVEINPNIPSTAIHAAARTGGLMGLKSGSVIAIIGSGPGIGNSINNNPINQNLSPPVPAPGKIAPLIGVGPGTNNAISIPNVIGQEISGS